MEAKDTVMKEKDIRQPARTVRALDYQMTRLELFRICKEEGLLDSQDKISFLAGQEYERGQNYDRENFIYKKGKNAGIREGVEKMLNDFVSTFYDELMRVQPIGSYENTMTRLREKADKWQSFKQSQFQEWGIKEGV